MNTQLQNIIYTVLSRNLNQRMTEELATGILTLIMAEYEKAVEAEKPVKAKEKAKLASKGEEVGGQA